MVADESLARRLHARNVEFFASLAPTISELGIGPGEPFLDMDGSVALFAGAGSPLNQASGSLTAEHLAKISEFFRGRTPSWDAAVMPFREPDALKRVKDLGGVEVSWESTFVRSLIAPIPLANNAPEITTKEVGIADLDTWSAVTTRGFFGDTPGEVALTLARIYERTNAIRRYMAFWEGEPVSTATLTPGSDIVFLGGMATLPEFRGRGLQTALLHRLLAESREIAGVATIGAAPGTTSHRNIGRAGFEPAFTFLSLRVPT